MQLSINLIKSIVNLYNHNRTGKKLYAFSDYPQYKSLEFIELDEQEYSQKTFDNKYIDLLMDNQDLSILLSYYQAFMRDGQLEIKHNLHFDKIEELTPQRISNYTKQIKLEKTELLNLFCALMQIDQTKKNVVNQCTYHFIHTLEKENPSILHDLLTSDYPKLIQRSKNISIELDNFKEIIFNCLKLDSELENYYLSEHFISIFKTRFLMDPQKMEFIENIFINSPKEYQKKLKKAFFFLNESSDFNVNIFEENKYFSYILPLKFDNINTYIENLQLDVIELESTIFDKLLKTMNWGGIAQFSFGQFDNKNHIIAYSNSFIDDAKINQIHELAKVSFDFVIESSLQQREMLEQNFLEFYMLKITPTHNQKTNLRKF